MAPQEFLAAMQAIQTSIAPLFMKQQKAAALMAQTLTMVGYEQGITVYNGLSGFLEETPSPTPPQPQPACCCCACMRIVELKLNAILELLIDIHTGKATDLKVLLGLAAPASAKGKAMSQPNQKGTGPAVKVACLCPAPKPGAKKMVMPDVTITSPAPASITLQPVDVNGAPVTLTPADTVTGTLTSDSASLTIAPGADTTKYIGTIPANTPQGSVANLAATLNGTIQGAPAALTASVKVTINLPPQPVATDLEILIA